MLLIIYKSSKYCWRLSEFLSVDNIKDHPILFPAVIIIIMEVLISKMPKLKGIRKMILIEEAWESNCKRRDGGIH